MPLTPFHMGPGLAVKSVAGDRFSLLMFGVAQVAIDIEPGIGLLRGSDVLHGWTHTYVGATLIAALVLALGRPACQAVLRRWNRELQAHGLGWLGSPDRIGWGSATAGAFAGTYSHVLVDSVMHADMRPLAPLSDANALMAALSYDALHVSCALAGLAGLCLWVALRALAARARPGPREPGSS